MKMTLSEIKELYKEYKANGGTENWNEFQHNHKTNYLEKYCSNIEMVENYELAKRDNFKGWYLHHRLETHNSDGELRKVVISRKELIALDMYYNRPASELIYLTKSEHSALHARFTNKNAKKISNTLKLLWQEPEYRQHMSDAHKNQSAWNKGKKLTDEYRRKLSEAHKGKSSGNKGKCWSNPKDRGKHWYTNEIDNIRCFECPIGYHRGRTIC